MRPVNLLPEPNRPTFGFEDHRHAVVKRRAQFVRFEDARVVIGVAQQHRIPSAVLANSMARVPAMPMAPPSMNCPPGARTAGSI
jgi:hypothetical protein